MSKNKKKLLLSILIIFVIIALDQTLKIWIKTTMHLGELRNIFGTWFNLYFIENPGMAFGMEIDVKYGKEFLTIFRLLAVSAGFYYLITIIKRQARTMFIVCVSLIIAGALGNIIDSLFYGMYFKDMNNYQGGFLKGHVVDMLYFPLVEGHYPSWVPSLGGQKLTFFSPIFNLADSAISVGIFSILLFHKRLLGETKKVESTDTQPESASIEVEKAVENSTPNISPN